MALTGIKILDFSRLLPGPLCSAFLTRLGAQVIKIEGVKTSQVDYVRDMRLMFEWLNAGKLGLSLDVQNEKGKNILARIARDCDVVLEGNRPGVMKRLGLDYETLSEDNKGLIYCSISGYGATGPLSSRAGHDVNFAALAGIVGMSGKINQIPPMLGFQAADAAGAMQATIGILAAVIERQRTGRGQHVDVSLCESAFALGVPSLASALSDPCYERGANMLDGGLPNYNVYSTQDDKYLAVGSLEARFWEKVCVLVGRPDLQHSPSPTAVKELFASKRAEEWLKIFEGEDVCIELVLSPEEVFSHEQHVSRGVVQYPPPNTDDLPQIVFGPRMGLHPAQRLPRAPCLGEHTRQVLLDHGFSESEVDDIVQLGVIKDITANPIHDHMP